MPSTSNEGILNKRNPKKFQGRKTYNNFDFGTKKNHVTYKNIKG